MRPRSVGSAPAALDTLAPFFSALCGAKAVRIGVAGASVTFGHGLRNVPHADAWPAVLERALRRIWGREEIHVKNAAIPSSTAPFAALCYESLFPEPLDLVIVEYSMTTRRASMMAPLLEVVKAHDTPIFALDLQYLMGSQMWMMCRMDSKRSAGTLHGQPCDASAVLVKPWPLPPLQRL